ncbi:hypothetical protein AX17_003690, partial [Amanita inopinata Kibby_2008]
MGDHNPPVILHSLLPPSPAFQTQTIAPIPTNHGAMAVRLYQDGTTDEHSEYILNAVCLMAKSFLDGDALFNPNTGSIDIFLNNYLFD